ncbi:MAG: hypothetical protein NC098_00640 [Lachnoclostridium sp.]|nr:hypothetical protein [Lachnoclostridium sp.]
MNKIISLICFVMAAVCATSCASNDSFEIKCHIAGLGTAQVDMVYYDGLAVKTVVSHGVDDEVTISGVSPQYTIAEIFTADGQLLLSTVVKNGDKISVDFDPEKSGEISIKGNDPSGEIAAFMRDNAGLIAAGSADSLNIAVEKIVTSQRDALSSTVLLMTYYDFSADPQRGDSILNLLTPEARQLASVRNFTRNISIHLKRSGDKIVRPISIYTSRDSAFDFVPYRHSCSILIVTDGNTEASHRTLLRKLRKDFKDEKLDMAEISVAPDSAVWRASIKSDSATWHQGWLQGSLGNPSLFNLAITSQPCIIVADQSGRQIYRGRSTESADSIIRHFIASDTIK